MRTEGWAVFNSDDAGVLAHWKFHRSVNTSIWANNATMHAHTLDQHKTHTPPPSLDVFPHTESSLARRQLRIWMRHCWKESEEHQYKTDDRSNTHTDQTLWRTQNGRSNFALQTCTLSSQSHERGRKILEREINRELLQRERSGKIFEKVRERLGGHCPLHTDISTAFTLPIMVFFHWYLNRPNLNDNIIWHSIKYILQISDIVIFAAIWERFNILCCLDILAERTKRHKITLKQQFSFSARCANYKLACNDFCIQSQDLPMQTQVLCKRLKLQFYCHQ